MNLNVLRYIIAVTEEQNFTAAAKRLHISQPSLSQSIRALEKQLGTEFFDRNASPLALTPSGELYLKWARQTVYTQQQVERQITDMTTGTRTVFSIGASAERTRYLLSPIMGKFFDLRPNCTVKVYDVPSAQLIGLLEKEQIDMILGLPEVDIIRYTSCPIGEEQTLLAVPVDHPLNLPPGGDLFPQIDLRVFKDAPFVALGPEQMLGRALLQYCDASGFVPNIRLECRLLHNLHNMIAAGVGVGLVSLPFVRRFRDDSHVRYYSLSGISAVQHIAAIYRNDHYLSRDAEVLISLLQTQAAAGIDQRRK